MELITPVKSAKLYDMNGLYITNLSDMSTVIMSASSEADYSDVVDVADMIKPWHAYIGRTQMHIGNGQ